MGTGKFYYIEDGPSLDRILDSFKYANIKRAFVDVWFTITDREINREPRPLRVSNIVVTGINYQHSTSSNDSTYCVFGNCILSEDGENKPCSFNAYYSPQRRQGSISFW